MSTAAPAFNAEAPQIDYTDLYDRLMDFLKDQTNPVNVQEAKRLIMEFARMGDDATYASEISGGHDNAPYVLADACDFISTVATSVPPYLHRPFIHGFDQFDQARKGNPVSFYLFACDFAQEKVQDVFDQLSDGQEPDMNAINEARLYAIALAGLSLEAGETNLDVGNKNELIEYLNPTRFFDETPPVSHRFTEADFDALWNENVAAITADQALEPIFQERYAGGTHDGVTYPAVTWTQIGSWLCEGLDKTLELSQQATSAPAAAPAPGSAP